MRKVTFSLGQHQYRPNMTKEETQRMEEITRTRNGILHAYTQEVDMSKDLPFVKTMALVEDIDEGQMYIVDPLRITFDEPYHSN